MSGLDPGWDNRRNLHFIIFLVVIWVQKLSKVATSILLLLVKHVRSDWWTLTQKSHRIHTSFVSSVRKWEDTSRPRCGISCTGHVSLYLQHIKLLYLLHRCRKLLSLGFFSYAYPQLVKFLPVLGTRLMVQTCVARASYLALACSILAGHNLRLLIILRHKSSGDLIIDISTRKHSFVHQWWVLRVRHKLRKIEFTGHHIRFFRSRRHFKVHLKDFKLYSLLFFGITLATLEWSSHWGAVFIGYCFAKKETCLVHRAYRVLLMFLAIKSAVESVWWIHLTGMVVVRWERQVLNVHFCPWNLLRKYIFSWLNQLCTTFIQSTDCFQLLFMSTKLI